MSIKRPFGAKKYSEILREGLRYIDDRRKGRIKSFKTPWLGLNSAGIGGLEWGSMLTIGARPGCLSGDTVLDIYRHYNKKSHRNGSRKYTLKELYYKFNGLLKPRNSKNDKRNGNYWDLTVPSKLYSHNKNEQCLNLNNIVNVIESGVKETFTIITESGKQLRATKDHRFLISENDEYLELENLKVGDYLYCRTDKHVNKGRKPRLYRFEYVTKMPYYPSAREKIVESNGIKYVNHRIKKTRAVYDAALNNVTLDVFLENVKTNPNHNYIFSNLNMDIHHIDENPHNDIPENLILLSKEEHARLHSSVTHIDRINRKKIVKEKIISIVSFGKEMTYDIEMTSPYNNFVANDFVVHNSGKTLVVNQIIREARKNNPTQDFSILDFQFEMGGKQSASRAFAAETALDYNVVLSTHKDLDDYSFKMMEDYVLDCEALENVGIQREVISDALTHADIKKAIEFYYNDMGGKPMLVTIDHSWLIKRLPNEQEKITTLYNTVEMLMQLKNQLPIIIVMITQLNRGMEEYARRTPGTLANYPTSSDIFGGDALMQGSDMVIALSRPSTLNIRLYGDKAYMVKDDDIFVHLLKIRNGMNDKNILFMKAEFNKQRMIEVSEPLATNNQGGRTSTGYTPLSQRTNPQTSASTSDIDVDAI